MRTMLLTATALVALSSLAIAQNQIDVTTLWHHSADGVYRVQDARSSYLSFGGLSEKAPAPITGRSRSFTNGQS
jgi:hypothetical protein